MSFYLMELWNLLKIIYVKTILCTLNLAAWVNKGHSDKWAVLFINYSFMPFHDDLKKIRNYNNKQNTQN